MKRSNFFAIIVAAQLVIAALAVLFIGSMTAAASPKDPPIPQATAIATIAVGQPTATAGVPNPVSTTQPTMAPCTISFSDVKESDYFYEAVRSLYCSGAISGYSDNTFRPFTTTTRGQMVKVVVLASSLEIVTPAEPSFSDVSTSNPFYSFVETASAAGLVNGYADGTFRWYNNVTRSQLAKIVVVATGWQLVSPTNPTFNDVSIANPFYSAIETAYAHGALNGYDTADGRQFRPYANATRGQIVKIINLALAH